MLIIFSGFKSNTYPFACGYVKKENLMVQQMRDFITHHFAKLLKISISTKKSNKKHVNSKKKLKTHHFNSIIDSMLSA